VQSTASHPDGDTLGWSGFSNLIQDYPLPVYALGGMRHKDELLARSHGAHGLAMQRHCWI
jgi:8-oxo-dGTP diphosphatase